LENLLSVLPLERGKGGFEKKMSFFIKSPLTPLCQRGEERGALPKGEKRNGAFPRRGIKREIFQREGNNMGPYQRGEIRERKQF